MFLLLITFVIHRLEPYEIDNSNVKTNEKISTKDAAPLTENNNAKTMEEVNIFCLILNVYQILFIYLNKK